VAATGFVGHPGIAEYLLSVGASFSADENGWTEAHNRVAQGDAKALEFLLVGEYDLNARGRGERSLLHGPVFQGDVETVQRLIAAGIDLNGFARSDFLAQRHTALEAAAHQGNLELIDLLIKNGAEVNLPAGKPLHYAVQKDFLEVVKFLLDAGADVNRQAGSPLHMAVHSGHLEILGLLLDSGADVNAEWSLSSPICYAVRMVNVEVVEMLLARGARTDIWCGESRKPLQEVITSATKNLAKRNPDKARAIARIYELLGQPGRG
jgi:ankyrin repeat protein